MWNHHTFEENMKSSSYELPEWWEKHSVSFTPLAKSQLNKDRMTEAEEEKARK
jgi:hypothetical protein